jgi:hypothetical protein
MCRRRSDDGFGRDGRGGYMSAAAEGGAAVRAMERPKRLRADDRRSVRARRAGMVAAGRLRPRRRQRTERARPDDRHARALSAGRCLRDEPCTTAPNIVGLVRFFATAASTTGDLKVEVLVKGKTYLAGSITAGSGWAPAAMLSSNGPAYKGAVAYQGRLTASGAAFTVDDIYFDPYSSK